MQRSDQRLYTSIDLLSNPSLLKKLGILQIILFFVFYILNSILFFSLYTPLILVCMSQPFFKDYLE